MVVEDKDIAQINATIIVGLFFFLGFGNYAKEGSWMANPYFAATTTLVLLYHLQSP